MIITYYGHSCFKVKGKQGTVVTDPYDESTGLSLPRLSADIVTVSHDHQDHNNYAAINGTVRRDDPFIIDQPGEYEVGGNSVFGVSVYHDDQKGESRGKNNIFTIMMDGLKVCHLGDLGHELEPKIISEIGLIDILFVPVGDIYTIGPKQAVNVAQSLDPNVLIPMHYKTSQHNEEMFGQIKTLKEFLNVYGGEVEPIEKLNISVDNLPEEMEVFVLEQS